MSPATVVAVCPVFNPPADVQQRLTDLAAQVKQVIVIDDGSSVAVTLEGQTVVRLDPNRGIAGALNVGLALARDAGASHILTIDQDSSFPPDYVDQLLACEERAVRQGLQPAAIGAVEFSGLRHKGDFHDGVMVVPESIQSGTMFRVDRLEQIGGFDERLVIDGVDTDVCLRLQDAGYDVCVAPVAFTHKLGEGHFVSVLGHQVWSSRHQPFRRYYITRNGVALLRRHGRGHLRWAAVSARRLTVATLLAAKDPSQRPAIKAGFRDALAGRLGQQWDAPRQLNG